MMDDKQISEIEEKNYPTIYGLAYAKEDIKSLIAALRAERERGTMWQEAEFKASLDLADMSQELAKAKKAVDKLAEKLADNFYNYHGKTIGGKNPQYWRKWAYDETVLSSINTTQDGGQSE